MSPRTLWTVILKVFGLYLFLQLLYQLAQVISLLPALLNGQYGSDSLFELSLLLLSLGIYVVMVAAFIFKTDWVINVLRLTKGMAEEKVELNIHRSVVLKIVIIISGVFLFAESLPTLLKDLFRYYQYINLYNGFKKYPSGGLIIFNLVKLMIGFFMMTSSRLIVNYIESQRRGKIKPEETGQ